MKPLRLVEDLLLKKTNRVFAYLRYATMTRSEKLLCEELMEVNGLKF